MLRRLIRRDRATLFAVVSGAAMFGFLAGLGYAGRFFHVTQDDHRSLATLANQTGGNWLVDTREVSPRRTLSIPA